MATIDSNSLIQEDPLKVAPPVPDTNNYPATTKANADYLASLTADANTKTTALDTAQTNDTNTVSKLLSDLNFTQGKTADTNTALETSGANAEKANLDKYNQSLNDINAQSAGLANEAKAIPLKVQNDNANTGATDAGVAPQTTGQLRENAIKSLTLASQADILTANINNSTIRYNSAVDKANKAIDLKYKPVEDEINNLQTTLNLNKTYITDPAEKKALAAQQLVINQKQKVLDQQKADETSVSNLKLEAIKNYGSNIPPAILSSLNGKTPDQAQTILAPYLKTNTNEITKLTNGDTVVVDKVTGNVVRNLGGGTADPSTLPPTSVVRTVTTPTGSTAVNGYTMVKGDDAFHIAQANNTDLATLKSLNPDIQDWANLPVGTVLNLPNTDDAWLNGKTPDQISAYNSIPNDQKEGIKELINGTAQLTDIVKSRGAKTQTQINSIITQAAAVDPTFNINSGKLRYDFQKKWNDPSAKENIIITSTNTALDHAAHLMGLINQLNNTGNFKSYNSLTQAITKETNGKNAGTISEIKDTVDLLGTEIAKAYSGGVPDKDSIAEQKDSISASQPANIAADVLNNKVKLMATNVLNQAEQYKKVMGRYPVDPIVNPRTLADLKTNGVDTAPLEAILKEQGYNLPQSDPTQGENYNGITLPTMPQASGAGSVSGFKLKY